ncbi:DUF7311 family protein [Halobacterium zhouii]|uniref:DUF7311 family protein n=1 Tax=Halobacterium zhouii TaxID=2902624 RepID=UPI001E385B86|nr:hypothetical protein [Halobacterium zhouii]
MIVRTVLAVLAALALVAAAQPAVHHATRTRDAAALRTNADEFADSVRALARRSDPGRTLATAPRRTLDLVVPDGATLAVRGEPARLVTRLDGAPAHRRSLATRVVTCTDDGTLEGPTTLAYVRTASGPVVFALRGFIRGNASIGVHACAPSTVQAR